MIATDAIADPGSTPLRPAFEPFQWMATNYQEVVPSHLCTDLAGYTRDIAAGVGTLVELFEREEIDRGSSDEHGNDLPALLPAQARGDLLRLAICSLQLLAEKAEYAQNAVRRQRDRQGNS